MKVQTLSKLWKLHRKKTNNLEIGCFEGKGRGGGQEWSDVLPVSSRSPPPPPWLAFMKASASGRTVVWNTKTLQCLHQAVRTLAPQEADLKEPCFPFSIPFLPFPSSIPLLLEAFPVILLLLFLLPSFLYSSSSLSPLLLPPPCEYQIHCHQASFLPIEPRTLLKDASYLCSHWSYTTARHGAKVGAPGSIWQMGRQSAERFSNSHNFIQCMYELSKKAKTLASILVTAGALQHLSNERITSLPVKRSDPHSQHLHGKAAREARLCHCLRASFPSTQRTPVVCAQQSR